MNLFEKILYFLQGEMPRPDPYGWFHILALVTVIAATVLLCVFFKDASDRTYRRIIFIGWCLIVLTEIYKQLVYSMDVSGLAVTWDYEWYAFPYQLCSTPLYVLPLIVFLPDGRIRDAAMLFTGTFAFFGGLAVMLYPGDVFIEMIGINIQTMLHHGMQVALGVYTMVYRRRRNGRLSWISALPVFAVLVALALISNIAAYHIMAGAGMDETFNMFYIGPYYSCHLPLLSVIWDVAPYPVFLCTYIIGFSIVAVIMYYAVWGLCRLAAYLSVRFRSSLQ